MQVRLTIDGKDVIRNLNRIARFSSESLRKVTRELANNTMATSRNLVGVNFGTLRDSHVVTTFNYEHLSISYLTAGAGATNQWGQPYIGYHYYGTGVYNGGSPWVVGRDLISQISMHRDISRYQYFDIDVNTGEVIAWHLRGQQGTRFLERALSVNRQANFNLANSIFTNYIRRGVL